MDKIKSVLTGHKKTDDTAQNPTVASTSATPQTQTPIYNKMASQGDTHAVGQAQNSAGQGREHIATDSTLHTGTEQPPHFSNTPNVNQSNPTPANSVTSSIPTNTASSNVRPNAPADAASSASIKSGVIGFGTSERQGHAALPNKNIAEDDLDSNQILGGGSSGSVTGEQKNIQPSILPHPDTTSRGQQDSAYSGSSIAQPLKVSSQQENYTPGADRSFPLSGGVTSRDPDNTSSSTRQLGTGSSALLPHSERRDVQNLAKETREATYGNTGDELPTTEQDRTGLLAGIRPFNKRTDTHPHIPGEFPDPTPTENPSQTFFGQESVGATSTTAAPSTQSELRHTGTLDQPRPKSGDFTPDQPRHQGRGAAIAGGVGAAGLGTYAASHKHDTGSESPYEASPYGSTVLDPRVHGRSVPSVEQQKIDPQTGTEPFAQRSLPIRESKDSSTVPAPSIGSREEPESHHGRDAAAVGAGIAAAGGLYGVSQRDHTPDIQRPTSESGTPATKQSSKAPDAIYGTTGTPASGIDNTHSSTSTIPLSSVTPESHTKNESQTHHGRDAALGGAGLVAAGELHHANQREERVDTGPASKTVGPHSSNIANVLDPRVQPDPAKQKSHNLSGPHQSDTLSRQDPKIDEKTGHQDQHHYGRDAAIAGGVGATGYGAYEAAKAYGDHRSTQPEASMINQRYDPTAPGAHAPSPIPAYAEYNYNEPRNFDQQNTGLVGNQHGAHDIHDHNSRNAALGAGVGAAALTGAAFTGTTHHDSTRQLPDSENPVSLVASSAAPVPISNYQQWQPLQSEWPTSHTTQEPSASSIHPTEGSSSYNTIAPTVGSGLHQAHGTTAHGSSVPVAKQHHGDVESLEDGNHNKRNAAVLGTAGTAALAGAGHTHHDASQPAYDSVASSAYPSQGMTSHTSNIPIAPATQQRYDNVDGPENRSHDNRNAALLGTAGAATLAGAGYAHHNANKPTYDSSAASAHPTHDSSVAPAHQTYGSSTNSSYPTQGTTSHASQIPNAPAIQQRHEASESIEDRSHDKRNAALVGATGAAALAGAGYAHHNATQPTQDSSTYATHAPATTAIHPSQPAAPYGTQTPGGIANQQRYDPVESSERQSHDKRNAALLGTAGTAAALGTGHAYQNSGQPTQDPKLYGSQAPTTGVVHPATTGYNTQVPATTHQHHDTVEDPALKDHDKRNTALLGTAGAATIAGAGYAYAQKQDQQNLLETQERLAKMEKQHEKEQAKLEKDTYKQQEKDQHKLDKERAKLQKSYPEEEEKEKKHGILGFLHRDKSKKEKTSPSAESSPRASRDYSHESPRHSKEHPDARTTAAAYEALPVDVSGRNRLHKDPPKGHPAREALEHPEVFASGGLGPKERIGVDGPIGHPDLISGDRETQRNTYGAHPISDLDSDKVVIEPRTGLPMNVGRYGDGHGGVDGSSNISGGHFHDPANTAAGSSSTNWEGTKKTDTPY